MRKPLSSQAESVAGFDRTQTLGLVNESSPPTSEAMPQNRNTFVVIIPSCNICTSKHRSISKSTSHTNLNSDLVIILLFVRINILIRTNINSVRERYCITNFRNLCSLPPSQLETDCLFYSFNNIDACKSELLLLSLILRYILFYLSHLCCMISLSLIKELYEKMISSMRARFNELARVH